MSRIAAMLMVATLGLCLYCTGCGMRPGASAATDPSTTMGLTSAAGDDNATSHATHPKPASPSSSFPSEDARTALRAAQAGLRSCGDSATPTPYDVALQFAPTGKVSKVDIVPAEGPAASCVRTRLSEVAVTPFEGEAVTLRLSVQL